MSDKSAHVKQPLSKLALVSLIVAVVGICVPIAWDYWKNTTDLTVRQTGKLPLLIEDRGLKKLHIFYGTNEVTQITRFNFSLENTGRTPIRDRDIVIPIQICISDGNSFIDASIDKVEPTSVAATACLTNNNQNLLVQFPLANPADKILFSALVNGSNPVVTLQSRVVGVRDVRFSDETAQTRKPVKWWSNLSLTVSIATAFLLALMKLARGELREAATAKLLIEADMERLSKFTKKSDFLNYINNRLDQYLEQSDKRKMMQEMETLVPGEGVTEENKPKVIKIIKQPVEDTIELNQTASKVIFGTLLVGLGYLVVMFIRMWM